MLALARSRSRRHPSRRRRGEHLHVGRHPSRGVLVWNPIRESSTRAAATRDLATSSSATARRSGREIGEIGHISEIGEIGGQWRARSAVISGHQSVAITCAERDPSVAITCAEGDHHWRARPALKLAYALSTPHSSLWGRRKRWAPVVIRGNQWPSIAITCEEGGSGGPRWPDQWSAAVRRGNHARGHQDPTALCLKGARSAPSPACRPTCSHSQSRHRSH